MKRLILLLVALAVVVGGGAAWWKFFAGESAPTLRFAPVKRGDLHIAIGASGVVQPEEVVDIGAQVAGKINTLGPDPRGNSDSQFKDKMIDFNTPVKEGIVLAVIDDAVYRAVRDQARASLDHAKADLLQLQAKLDQAEQDWKRAQTLYDMKSPITEKMAAAAKTGGIDMSSIKGIADSDYDLAKANYEIAKANVEVGKSVIEQNEAALQLAETNLGYTVIKSPVNGTVIARRVNIGQTVVSSLNAPSLFLIAKDLTKMQVWASVNEADVGRVREGMPVHFTVDKVPDEVFHGRVSQIRLNATMTQNVVTYTVVISAENPELKLFPYLTADVEFEIENLADVLLVPNAALAWQPQPNMIAPEYRDSFLNGKRRRGGTGGGQGGEQAQAPAQGDTAQAQPAAADQAQNQAQAQSPQSQGQQGQGQGRRRRQQQDGDDKSAANRPAKPAAEKKYVWVKDDEFVRPVEVRIGATDGTTSEVNSEELKEGMEIVTGEIRVAARGGDGQNPFAPQVFGGRRRGG